MKEGFEEGCKSEAVGVAVAEGAPLSALPVRRVVRIRGYHAFVRKGSWFIYDMEASRFFRVAPVVVEVLRRLSEGACEDAILAELGKSFGEAQVATACRELRL